MNQDIYNMKLHEYMQINGWYISRVAGGWIYGQGNGLACVFVPFDNEFQTREQS